MLDVHPPHKSIGSAGEFFLHLLTITIGLLIAVGIEGGVEWYHHHELAAEARATMTSEIRKNARTTNEAMDTIRSEQKTAKDSLAGLLKIQLNPNDPAASNLSLHIGYDTVDLDDTGWRTAQATGALAYMPYAESERFSTIYESEQAFLKAEEKLAEDEAAFLGTVQKFHLGSGKLNKDAADAMAEKYGIWQGHLLALKIAALQLQEDQNAFLEGREPKSAISERLSG
jgi:hypothetical protein